MIEFIIGTGLGLLLSWLGTRLQRMRVTKAKFEAASVEPLQIGRVYTFHSDDPFNEVGDCMITGLSGEYVRYRFTCGGPNWSLSEKTFRSMYLPCA